MHSQDVFRRTLRRLAGEIDPWLQQLGDVARVEREWTGDEWRLEMRPHAPAACALELLLRTPDQADIAIAGETFEGIDPGGVEALVPLIRAVSEGRVTHVSAIGTATGRPLGTSVIVDLGEGRRLLLGTEIPAGIDAIRRERHFAPYRR